MIKGKVLPNDFFLVRDKSGQFHWYKNDPLKNANRKESEVNIEMVIADVVGIGSIANPVMVRLNCAKVDRSVEFNVSLLASVRSGSLDKHFEDMKGNIIDLSEYHNSDVKFPLTGVVFSSAGEVLEVRKYSFNGECSDGNEDHHLLVLNGEARFEKVEQK